MTMLLKLLLFASLVQNPTPVVPKPTTIEGIVTSAGSGTPLQEAGVELSRVGSGESLKYTVASRADGMFSFQDVPPGDYRIAAARPGFVRAEYGQRGPGGTGLTITVAAGDNTKGIRIPLTETGAISGRVLDSYGRPIPNAQVQAFRLLNRGPLSLLDTARAVITNDRGEYRLFWLSPDEYVVMAMPIRGAIGDQLIKTDGNGNTFTNRVAPATGVPILPPEDRGPIPFFYGGTNDPSTATHIRINPADDLGAIDIAILPVPTFSVRGRILNLPMPANTALANRLASEQGVAIRVEPRTPPSIRFRNEMPNGVVSVNMEKGTFEIRGVLPGSYWVNALYQTFDQAGELAPPQGIQARASLDVSGKDVDGVTISFSKGFDVPLRVVLDNQPEGPAFNRLADSLRLYLTPVEGGAGVPAEPVPGQVGSFIVRNVAAGDYSLGISTIGGVITYHKTTRVEGIDRREAFRIDRTPSRPIEVVYGLSTGTIRGTVTNNSRESLSGATVVAIGVGPLGSFHSTSGPGGKFEITNVPPGNFVIYAWESIPLYTWQDPAVIRRAAGRSTNISLDDGGSASVNVIALPAEGPGK